MQPNDPVLASKMTAISEKKEYLQEKALLDNAVHNNWDMLTEEDPDWDMICAQAAGLAAKIGMIGAACLFRELAAVLERGKLGSTVG